MVESKILLKNGSWSSATHSGAEAYPKMISIITPSYNQGPFIEETIQSVLSQRGEFYIDYIVMDGHSTDQSVEIIKKYENLLKENCSVIEKDNLNYYVKKKDDFLWNHCLGISFRWISEKDRGQVDALKKGFRMARGDIYCWMNSDDIYVHPDVLQKVRTYFEKEPGLKLLFGDGPFISKTGEKLKLHHVENINLKELLYLDYHILQPSTFFHKDIYNETHLDEQLTCAFDADFFIRMLYNGVKYKKVNDCFGAFRLYEENKTLRLTKTRHKELIQIANRYSKRGWHPQPKMPRSHLKKLETEKKFVVSAGFCRRLIKSHYFLMVSTVYRTIQGIYEARFKKKKPFVWVWILIRRICYKLITGKWKR